MAAGGRGRMTLLQVQAADDDDLGLLSPMAPGSRAVSKESVRPPSKLPPAGPPSNKHKPGGNTLMAPGGRGAVHVKKKSMIGLQPARDKQ